jgi:N-acetylmuramoyl-L-alanine amidase
MSLRDSFACRPRRFLLRCGVVFLAMLALGMGLAGVLRNRPPAPERAAASRRNRQAPPTLRAQDALSLPDLEGAGSGSPMMARPPDDPPSRRSVCIDPGHPSEISDGLQVVNGITENHCNWVIALRLKRILEEAGFRVVLTKQAEEERVTNRRRAEIANEAEAALMVRLHCDYGSGTGFQLFYPAVPGRFGSFTGPSPEVCRESRRAAEALHAGLEAHLQGELKDNGIKTDRSTKIGKEYGALIGSIFARVPAVTVEMAFLSHPKDAAFLKSEAGQQKLARGLATGIKQYLGMGKIP